MYLKAGRRSFLIHTVPLCAVAAKMLASAPELADGDKDKPAPPKEEEVFQPGGDVKAPKLIHYVEPEFSPNSKEAFVEGVVRISTVVTTEGQPSAYRVVSGLNAEEDKTAVEALKKWKFQPGSKNGRPVNVRVTVEVEFHLL